MNKGIVAGIEAGGTKIVCAATPVGDFPNESDPAKRGDELLERVQFPTRDDPDVVLEQLISWLETQQNRRGPISGIGVASFGPVGLHPDQPHYGSITATPKPGWSFTDIVGPLARAFPQAAIGFDTDVNGAALGEYVAGAADGLPDFVYITMGTGIGGGGMHNGELLHGMVHPEMGHLLLPAISGDEYPGSCPYHGRCWEGLCSGPAILARTGSSAENLSADDPVWDLVTTYTALALTNIFHILSPQRILIGGSVRKAGQLGETEFFDRVREYTLDALGGYVHAAAVTRKNIATFIQPPALGDDAGVIGALELGRRALAARKLGRLP